MIAEAGKPSNSDGDGRTKGGKFAPGNKFSKGNLGASRVAELRRLTLDCATDRRHLKVLNKLYRLALSGDMDAIREWLNRTLGKPVQAVSIVDDEQAVGGFDPRMSREELGAKLDRRAVALAAQTPSAS